MSASFQFVVDALRGDWHVIAPDWRGCGLTAWAPGGYWFPDYYADLDALQKGDKSPEVKKIQEALVARGYKIGTDGDFGPGTENAVKQFQQSQGLAVTGVVDKETAAKLV